MGFTINILLCIVKLQLFCCILCTGTKERNLFDTGSAIIDKGEVIHVNVTELNPKLYSMYLQRDKKSVNQFGKFNHALSSATFSCAEDDGLVSCINKKDKSSVFVEKCSNISTENKKNIAHIIAIIYRKKEDTKKNNQLSFYMTGPPNEETNTPLSTCDPCYVCKKCTCIPTPSTIIIQCGNHVTESCPEFKPAVRCVPLEYNENNTDYMCMSPSFKEPMRIASPIIANENYFGKLSSYTFADNTYNHLIKRKRKARHLKSVKTKHKMKKKPIYKEIYYTTDNILLRS